MLDRNLTGLVLFILFLLSSCGNSDISRSFNTDQANRLLSNDSEKVWSLIAHQFNGEDVFGPCSENNSITFVNATESYFYVLGRPITCGSTEPLDTLHKAFYTLVENNGEFSNQLDLVNEKFKNVGTIELLKLSSNQLQISYSVDETQIIEQYQY